MATILTYSKMQSYKPCSINNKAKIEQLISEVEMLELTKMLGAETYSQLVTDANQTTIADDVKAILEGGLYASISYFVYATYLINSSITDTFTGMVQKTRQDSESVSVGTLKNEQTRYKELAIVYFNQVKDKIEAKYSKTPQRTSKRVQIHSIKKHFGSGEMGRFDTTYFND